MKIISFLIYTMNIGGAERVTHELINEYVSEGFKVNLFCLWKIGSLLTGLNISEQSIYEIGEPSSMNSVFKISKKISKLLEETKTDYFISMGEWPNIITPFVKFKGKYLIVEHSTKTFFSSPNEYNLPLKIKILSKIAYKRAPKILCVSKTVKEILVSKNKKFSSKAEIIYNPINYEKIKELSREEIDYKTKKIKIISVCRFTANKNIQLLIQAFSEVHKDIKNIELWLVGDGDLRKELEIMVRNLGINDSVIFWGFQENPYKFISKADLFISTSNYEGFSLVLFEALYLKKRIITTRVNSDITEFITPKLGVVVPVGDKEELAKAIKNEILTNNTIDNTPALLELFSTKIIAEKYLYYLNKNKI